MMGGTDPSGLTDGVLRGLVEIREDRLVPVVIAPPAARSGLSTLLDRFVAHQWLERVDAPTLAGWAQVCRCAVSACGGTLYELAALGLPFVGVIAADNQRAFAAAVTQHWCMPVVDGRTEGGEAVASPLRALLREPPPRAPFGGVDGLGVVRVIDALERAG
jgi:spore coat polysaccharide biosynthesis predicted glycosyltransferase SpsG